MDRVEQDNLANRLRKFYDCEGKLDLQTPEDWEIIKETSSQRENIVIAMPISPNDTVVEVDSSYGAITGALAKKADKVYCVENDISAREICMMRHKENNIHYVNLLSDIKEDFNTIVMMSPSHARLEEVLETIQNNTQKEMKIIIACDNRFGLSYLNGYTARGENRFQPIQSRNNVDVRQYALGELQTLLKTYHWIVEQAMYPYPDFMFTTEIFTDECLPKAGSLKNNERYSSELRFRMFDEDAAFDNVIQAKEFTHFSNSFLVIAEKEEHIDE